MINRNLFLITGINGFCGFFMANYILAKNVHNKIIGLDLDEKLNVQKKWFARKRINYVKDDLSSQEKLIKLLKKHKPQYLLHLAGSFSGVKITQYLQSNVISSLNLIESVTTIKNYQPRILLIGSASEYGQTPEKFLPTKEAFEGQPLNGYGWSKKIQNKLAIHYAKQHNLAINIACQFNLIGPHLKEGLFLSDFLKQIKDQINKNKILVKMGNLSTLRDFLDIRDTILAYDLILKSRFKGHVFNVCSGQAVTIKKICLELTKQLKEDYKIKIIIKENKKIKSVIKNSCGSNKKIKKMLNWQPKISLKESIKFILKEEFNNYVAKN